MKRKLVAIGLLVLMLFGLVSCTAESKEKDPIQEYIDSKKMENDTFTGYNKENELSKDPLTICMDVEYVQRDWTFTKPLGTILNDFLYTLNQSGGVSDVEILYVPKYGADREARLDRLRVEIMAGKGPDVFIMNSCGALNIMEPESEALFVYPEQAMENGLFLPLDDYMENKTRFAEWDKFPEAIMAAGKNWEGQQIIPLTYTLPILCIRKSDVDMDLTGASYTWDDMLHDPEISPYTRLMADCCTPYCEELSSSVSIDGTKYMEFALGQLVDFKEEELAFTEEELLQHIQEVLAMIDEQLELVETLEPDTKGAFDYYCTWLGWEMVSDLHPKQDNIQTTEPKSMFPLYSDDGGVTATILSWAAVSRNTDKPDEAYTVIDMLMRDSVQQKYSLYETLLVGVASKAGIPMHEDLLHPDMPFGRGMVWSLTEENYNELCEIRSQITGANFHGELSTELYTLFDQCAMAHLNAFGFDPGDDFTTVEEAVHEAYEKMQRMVRE